LWEERDVVEEGREDECRAEDGEGAMTLPGASNEGRTGEANVVAKEEDMMVMSYRIRCCLEAGRRGCRSEK